MRTALARRRPAGESQQQIDHRKGIVFNPGCAEPSIFPTMSSFSERTPTPNPTRQRHYRGSNNHEASGSSSSSSGTSYDMPPPKLPDLSDLSPFRKKTFSNKEKSFLSWTYPEEQHIWYVYFGYRFVPTAGDHLKDMNMADFCELLLKVDKYSTEGGSFLQAAHRSKAKLYQKVLALFAKYGIKYGTDHPVVHEELLQYMPNRQPHIPEGFANKPFMGPQRPAWDDDHDEDEAEGEEGACSGGMLSYPKPKPGSQA